MMTHGITLGSQFKTWCLAITIMSVCGACQKQEKTPETINTETEVSVSKNDTISNDSSTVNTVEEPKVASLDEILESQSDDIKARYGARKPKETLEFFGIKPGMTVAEVLPGDGWYTKILLPYLGSEGKLIAIDYPYSIWHHFNWASRDFINDRKNWPGNWETKANAWYEKDAAPVSVYEFENISDEVNGTADAILFIRALHNLNRFEERGQFFTNTLRRSHKILKDGGILGVVQHEAPEGKSLEWADGSRGYLNKADLIQKIESFGFSFKKESDLLQNKLDNPGEDDLVWRLPPALSTSQEDEALQEKMKAIGESNRMTLLFTKKPL